MTRIIIQRPDGTFCGNPENILIKRNGQSESLYKMLEEEKLKICRKMRNKNELSR